MYKLRTHGLYYNTVFAVFLNADDTYQVTGHTGDRIVGINIYVTKAILKL